MNPEISGVDWAAVGHAYGPATDVPALLAGLRSSHARAMARADLSNMRHQGTLYPAAAVTAPFLLELAADPELPERHEVVALVARLAVGYDAVAALIAAPDACRPGSTMSVISSYRLTPLFPDHDTRL